jgi:hypothetical protein
LDAVFYAWADEKNIKICQQVPGARANSAQTMKRSRLVLVKPIT